jgi:hypothetical protein
MLPLPGGARLCQLLVYIKAQRNEWNPGKAGKGGYRLWMPDYLSHLEPGRGDPMLASHALLFVEYGAQPHLFGGTIFWTDRRWDSVPRARMICEFGGREWSPSWPKMHGVSSGGGLKGVNFSLRAVLTWIK